MLNHTSQMIKIVDINNMLFEEDRLKKAGIFGQIEVDRVFENEIELIFDGVENNHMKRMIGKYVPSTNTFIWE